MKHIIDALAVNTIKGADAMSMPKLVARHVWLFFLAQFIGTGYGVMRLDGVHTAKSRQHKTGTHTR